MIAAGPANCRPAADDDRDSDAEDRPQGKQADESEPHHLVQNHAVPLGGQRRQATRVPDSRLPYADQRRVPPQGGEGRPDVEAAGEAGSGTQEEESRQHDDQDPDPTRSQDGNEVHRPRRPNASSTTPLPTRASHDVRLPVMTMVSSPTVRKTGLLHRDQRAAPMTTTSIAIIDVWRADPKGPNQRPSTPSRPGERQPVVPVVEVDDPLRHVVEGEHPDDLQDPCDDDHPDDQPRHEHDGPPGLLPARRLRAAA